MSSRNYIAEIIEIRERRFSNSSNTEIFERLSSIEDSFNNVEKNNYEVLKYFPIALVATMEGCFRVMATELIDHKEEYLDSCELLLKKHKISFELIKAFHGKQVSIGEFVSHITPINRLSDIDFLFTALMGKDFLRKLKTQTSRWDIEIHKKKPSPVIIDADNTYKRISRTFELRHIFCHETATGVEFDYEEIQECFLAVSIFLKASIEYISEAMYPNQPLSQAEMTTASSKKLDDVIEEIENTKKELINKLSDHPKRIEKLKLAHKKWSEYMESFSQFSSEFFEGGSVLSQSYYMKAFDLANNYHSNLKEELDMITDLLES